jgi:UDPglucose--hexose-1-phosphate uridylyltransferase
MPITFETLYDTMTLMRAGKKEELPFEIRTDPLTGRTGRVFNLPYRPPESPNADETFKRSEGMFCPFCPENIETSTPRFPEELVPGGKIQIGTATLLPNVLPLDRYVGIAVFSPQHFVRMEELTPEMMRDAFLAVLEFIRRVSEVDLRVDCFSINWNYMPPAGSSLVHPHLQVLCGDYPMNHMRLQLEGANRYYRENGREFWDDFIREEKERASRYIGEIGPTFWTVGYTPMTHIPDVWCVFPEQKSLLGLGEEALNCFLEGLSAVLTYYHTLNLFSFNLSIFSFKSEERFRVNARILPRLALRDIGNSDYTFLQTLHKESTCVYAPESVCRQIRERGFGTPIPIS